jgi:chaperone modulatory protein CbpM
MSQLQMSISHAAIVETELDFSLGDLCRACGTNAELIEALVREGILEPQGDRAAPLRFDGSELPRARRATRLMLELELNAAGAALVLDLVDQIETLRSRLRRHVGLDTHG